MASLYKRASPRQAMILRMVEGAVHNTMHAHPGRQIDDRITRGIAKRAAGTITSQWRSVLAAPKGRSEGESGNGTDQKATVGNKVVLAHGKRSPQVVSDDLGARHTLSWRAPLRALHRMIGGACGDARRTGNAEREMALKDVLRAIARLASADKPPRPGVRIDLIP